MKLKSIKKELGEDAVKHLTLRLVTCGCDVCNQTLAIWANNSAFMKKFKEGNYDLILKDIPYADIEEHLRRRKQENEDILDWK